MGDDKRQDQLEPDGMRARELDEADSEGHALKMHGTENPPAEPERGFRMGSTPDDEADSEGHMRRAVDEPVEPEGMNKHLAANDEDDAEGHLRR